MEARECKDLRKVSGCFTCKQSSFHPQIIRASGNGIITNHTVVTICFTNNHTLYVTKVRVHKPKSIIKVFKHHLGEPSYNISTAGLACRHISNYCPILSMQKRVYNGSYKVAESVFHRLCNQLALTCFITPKHSTQQLSTLNFNLNSYQHLSSPNSFTDRSNARVTGIKENHMINQYFQLAE